MANTENSKESKVVEVKAKSSNLWMSKNAMIIAAVVVFVFLLALVPILMNVLSDDEPDVNPDTPDLGIVLSGTYAGDIGVGSSEYTFDGNKATNTFVVNGEKKTIEYTYVIAVEGGVQVIKLTSTDADGAAETSTHKFEKGKFGEKPIILINDVMYYQK